jgi:hypothetical protein
VFLSVEFNFIVTFFDLYVYIHAQCGEKTVHSVIRKYVYCIEVYSFVLFCWQT